MTIFRVTGTTPAPATGIPAPATGTPAPATGTPAPATGTAAAADNPPRPSSRLVWASYGLIAAGAVVAWRVNEKLDPDPPAVPQGITVLVLLLVIAQAIERLLEPAVRLTVPDDKAKTRDDKVVAALKSPQDETKAKDAANAQKAVDDQRANVSVGVWAAATILGMLLSAITGAYMLQALGVKGIGDKPWIDIVMTGLAVGGGTKPLHDIISRIDEAKKTAKDPPETK